MSARQGFEPWLAGFQDGLGSLESVAAVPPFEGLFGILGKMRLGISGGDLAPRRGVVQHETDVLWRCGEGSVYRRGEGVNEVRVSRREEPQEAPTELAEVPLRLAGRGLVRPSAVVEPRVVDGEVFLALDLQGARVGPEVDGVAAAPGGLAADRTVAGLIRIRRLRL